MRSMLVIGAGRFGRHLAMMLTELGNEVLVVDKDEEIISKLEPFVTRAQIGDCMDEDALRSLGVSNFDVCFVCISENFQSSLEITSLLKELGAPFVVSKTDREIQAKFLRRMGADEIIYPERDMAHRAAVKYTARYAFDYIELSPEYAIVEVSPPESWVGRSIRDIDVRNRHNINIIGVKNGAGVLPITDPDRVFSSGEHMIIAGGKKDIQKMLDRQ